MKASELMVGDWVQNPLGAKGYVRAISWIPPDEEGLDSTHLITMVYEGCVYSCAKLEEEDILPVPLTPEILEKNEFVGHRGDYYFSIDHQLAGDGIVTDYITYYQNKRLSIHYADGEISTPCNYVHELQHALKLCGIEKEIIL